MPARPAGSASPVKARFRSGIPLPPDWRTAYLDHIREHGHYALAAKVAGVSQDTALRARHADPAFDALCREAREEAADRIEIKMLESAERSDNPAGFIVRLKALRPAEYIERHAIMNLTVSTHLDATDGLRLLQTMFADATDATRQRVVGSNATPPLDAMPPHPDPPPHAG